MVAFWACGVTETKAVAVDVPEGFVLNVCNAICDASSTNAQMVLGLETQQLDGKVWKGVVAHLGATQPLQIKLDLVFGRKVKFYLPKGVGIVNLTGYFQPGPTSAYLIGDEAEKSAQIEATSARKGKKRARGKKQPDATGQEEVPVSSSDSKDMSKKNAKAVDAKPSTTKQSRKEVDDVSETASVNPVSPVDTAQKKKRKRKHKKAAANGENSVNSV
uniref:Nucleoplasmin-like domain-containing protein n=1 Tax=Hyaloperonospora arabidopsidis (strain Emoy2) TaxID=559515 RepID=M4BFB5_HYAAE